MEEGWQGWVEAAAPLPPSRPSCFSSTLPARGAGTFVAQAKCQIGLQVWPRAWALLGLSQVPGEGGAPPPPPPLSPQCSVLRRELRGTCVTLPAQPCRLLVCLNPTHSVGTSPKCPKLLAQATKRASLGSRPAAGSMGRWFLTASCASISAWRGRLQPAPAGGRLETNAAPSHLFPAGFLARDQPPPLAT